MHLDFLQLHTTKLITKKCHATQKRPRCAYTHPNQSIYQHSHIPSKSNLFVELKMKLCVCVCTPFWCSKISKYSQYWCLLKINWIWLCVIFAHTLHTPTYWINFLEWKFSLWKIMYLGFYIYLLHFTIWPIFAQSFKLFLLKISFAGQNSADPRWSWIGKRTSPKSKFFANHLKTNKKLKP